MPKQEKIDVVSEIKVDIENSAAMFLTDYRGLRVIESEALRRKLRDVGAEYKVVKNTLFELAMGGNVDDTLKQVLAGPTAIAFVSKDPVAGAKALQEFMREHKAMSVKGGLVEGQFLTPERVTALSKIPPKEVLIAQMLGSIQAPLSGLVGTLQGVLSGLVYTLQAVHDQKAAS